MVEMDLRGRVGVGMNQVCLNMSLTIQSDAMVKAAVLGVFGQRPRQGTKSCRMGRNSVRTSIRPSVRPSVPPLAGPQTLLADPQTLLAGPQTLRAS